MNARGVSHVPLEDIAQHGIVRQSPQEGAGAGSGPRAGAVVQAMGSRQTFVWDGNRWLPQNDDLGAKLDAIQAAAEAQLVESRRQTEFLELIAEALTKGA